MKPTVVVLAAGLGTRMKSVTAKALHSVAGRPLVQHVLNAATALEPGKVILVLGHQADTVKKAVEKYKPEYVLQHEQLGTGHAVRQAKDSIAAASGPVMILCADTPLLTADTLKRAILLHEKTRSAITLITAKIDDPFGYGRVVRAKSGVARIIEEKDASRAQKKIKEVNAGIYCFEKNFLLDALDRLGKDNAQGEYYLPDTVALARKRR